MTIRDKIVLITLVLFIASCKGGEDVVKLEVLNPFSSTAEVSSNMFSAVEVPDGDSEIINVERSDQVSIHYEIDGNFNLAVVVFSTESGEEFAYMLGDNDVYNKSEKISCPGEAPSGYHCLEASGQYMPGKYQFPQLYGTWVTEEYGFCLTYRRDGTGTAVYQAAGLNPGGSDSFIWGVLANSYGMPIVSDNGGANVYQSVDDPQISMLGFDVRNENLMGWGFQKQNSCPF